MSTTWIEELEQAAKRAAERCFERHGCEHTKEERALRARADRIRELHAEMCAVVFRETGCGIHALAAIDRVLTTFTGPLDTSPETPTARPAPASYTPHGPAHRYRWGLHSRGRRGTTDSNADYSGRRGSREEGDAVSAEQEYVHDGTYRPCDACVDVHGHPTGTTKPGGLHLLTCLRCGGHGRIPNYRKLHPHLVGGEFQSDKYPTCPRGKVPLSTKDPMAQDLLWEYAQRRRSVDVEFAADLEIALANHGYRATPPAPPPEPAPRWKCQTCRDTGVILVYGHEEPCVCTVRAAPPEPLKEGSEP